MPSIRTLKALPWLTRFTISTLKAFDTTLIALCKLFLALSKSALTAEIKLFRSLMLAAANILIYEVGMDPDVVVRANVTPPRVAEIVNVVELTIEAT